MHNFKCVISFLLSKVELLGRLLELRCSDDWQFGKLIDCHHRYNVVQCFLNLELAFVLDELDVHREDLLVELVVCVGCVNMVLVPKHGHMILGASATVVDQELPRLFHCAVCACNQY